MHRIISLYDGQRVNVRKEGAANALIETERADLIVKVTGNIDAGVVVEREAVAFSAEIGASAELDLVRLGKTVHPSVSGFIGDAEVNA